MKSERRIRRISAVVLVIVMIAGMSGRIHLYRRHIENTAREVELEMMQAEIRNRIRYSEDMLFQNNFSYDGTPGDLNVYQTASSVFFRLDMGDIEINEVVFVNSAEEAEGFAEDVFVAWPTEWSDMYLELINGWLDPESRGRLQPADMVIDIDDLDIELPLTRDLMVEDWELMTRIRSKLSTENSIANRDADTVLRNAVERRIHDVARFGDEATED